MNRNDNHKAAHKKLLLDRKRKVWNELREEIFRKFGKDYNDQFDIPHDLEELSVLDLVEDLGLSVSDLRRQELESMEVALRKLDEGTYGTCSRCGAEIGDERLKAMPYAEHCLRCQNELEGRSGGRKPTL
ncbi:MAG: TraR/DksA C4-type zinc finger protein [Deltaproteobacteria bacterium]|nr:TraR/DksA C4-type zinc finger protein [Deltaproteobacteria bacterium]MCL4872763.1 TraR/DksA C4-type zinc finger protein [bacterium]